MTPKNDNRPESEVMTVLVLELCGLGHGPVPELMDVHGLEKYLSGFLSSMMTLIKKHGGRCGDIRADMITAFWEYDDAGKAGECALACVAEMNALAGDWFPVHPKAVFLQAGLSTGQVVVVPFAKNGWKSHVVYGEAVELARVLAGKNREYHSNIIITESVKEKLASRSSPFFLDSVLIKGKPESINLYRLGS